MSEQVTGAGVKPGFKTCSNPNCEQENPQPLSNFYKDRGSWRGNCKLCHNKKTKQSYQENRKERIKWQREYRAKDVEKSRQSNRASYHKNHETRLVAQRASYKRYREARTSSMKLYRQSNYKDIYSKIKEWRKKHPARIKAYSSRRRSRLKGAIGKHTGLDVKAKLEMQAGCYYCGASLEQGYHIDHKIPLAKGGSNWPSNLCGACASCNSSKKDRDFFEFIAFRGWQPFPLRLTPLP